MKQPSEAAVRSLIDAVYLQHGITAEAAMVASSFTDRLTTAELQYRTGIHKGVAIGNVVATINELAKRSGAPAYAYTDGYEVRKVRARLLAQSPELMGAAAGADSRQLPRLLSPAEAFHVTATLLYQKLYNPEFQLSSGERKAHWSTLSGERRAEVAAGIAQGRPEELLEVIHTRMATGELLIDTAVAVELLLGSKDERSGQ